MDKEAESRAVTGPGPHTRWVAAPGMKPDPGYSLLNGVIMRTHARLWQETVTTAPVSEVGS